MRNQVVSKSLTRPVLGQTRPSHRRVEPRALSFDGRVEAGRTQNPVQARVGRLPALCGRSAIATHIDGCDPSSCLVSIALRRVQYSGVDSTSIAFATGC